MSSRPPDLADRWTRAVASIKDGPLRVAYVRSEIARADAASAARALNDLCARAEQADARARDVLAAAVPSLTDEDLAPRVNELRALALESALHPLARLLRKKKDRPGAPSSREGSPGSSKEAPNRAAKAGARPLTLGERKALARTLRTKGALEKLLADPHPAVVRNLLGNPRITEDDIIRLVARRPASADILAEIVRHPAWSQRPRVRMAILQNPGAPAEIAVPLVRLLVRPELREIAAAADIAPVVRSAAVEILARRPPIPEGRGPGEPTQ
ncbi:MAG TPA: hypothetical protein VE093_33620 [Polyangiaceae bacterium]|jgi:hypothetical protein|nr:hypothetical protein [Polyangiaceae bacterium]